MYINSFPNRPDPFSKEKKNSVESSFTFLKGFALIFLDFLWKIKSSILILFLVIHFTLFPKMNENKEGTHFDQLVLILFLNHWDFSFPKTKPKKKEFFLVSSRITYSDSKE